MAAFDAKKRHLRRIAARYGWTVHGDSERLVIERSDRRLTAVRHGSGQYSIAVARLERRILPRPCNGLNIEIGATVHECDHRIFRLGEQSTFDGVEMIRTLAMYVECNPDSVL